MVMKRSSDSENFVKSKRIRTRTDLDDNGVRDRLSSPDSARDGSPNRRSSSLSRKPDDRTYKRSNMNMRNDNGYQTQQRKRIEREREPQIRITNLASHVGDTPMKEALFHEFKKFGDISVHLFGRGDERYAVVYFRSIEDAAEVKRNFDRRGRPALFDRQLRMEYFYSDRSSRRDTPDYVSTNQRESNHRSLSPPRRNRANNHLQFDYDQRNRGDQNDRRSRSGGIYNQAPREPYISPEDDPKATRTLFVGNLETIVSSQELKRAFERFGVVEDVDIKRPARGQGNTYAFVKFSDLDVAAKAKVEMQGEIIGHNRVKIGYGKSQQTTRLWVGGLGPWTSITDLEREFDRFGAIRRIDYKKSDDHAYILYDSLDAASVAAREMRGFTLNDRRLKIDFADKEQGLREYQDHQLPRALSPPRNRLNNFNRFDDHYQNRQNNHDFNDDRMFAERKREPSPFRRNAREDNNFQEWRGGDSLYRRPEFDRPVEDIRSGQRQFVDDNWQHNHRDIAAPPDEEPEDWGRRENRTTRERKYRNRGPQTPPIDDFRSYKPSPDSEFNDRTRKRKPRSPYMQQRDFHEDQSPVKRHRSPRTRSLSPDRPNHVDHAVRSSSRSRQSTPTCRRQSGSSSDGHTHSLGENHDKETRTGDMQFREKSYPTERNIVTETMDKKPLTAQNPISPSGSSGTETLQDLAKRFAIAWKGAFVLKNSAFPVRMHLVGGNPEVADSLLRTDSSGPASPSSLLRITQRLRLDQPKLEEVSRRMSTAGASGHCLLLAMPGGQTQLTEDLDGEEPLQQRPLRNLMQYLKQKQAAGVVNLPAAPANPAVSRDDVGVLHAFPPCQFSHEHLMRIAPHLSTEPSREDHLVIIVVRGSG